MQMAYAKQHILKLLGNGLGPAPAKMTKGRPGEGHPPDLALKTGNSIATIACNLPPNMFGGPGFPMQVQARIKVLSLDVCFA